MCMLSLPLRRLTGCQGTMNRCVYLHVFPPHNVCEGSWCFSLSAHKRTPKKAKPLTCTDCNLKFQFALISQNIRLTFGTIYSRMNEAFKKQRFGLICVCNTAYSDYIKQCPQSGWPRMNHLCSVCVFLDSVCLRKTAEEARVICCCCRRELHCYYSPSNVVLCHSSITVPALLPNVLRIFFGFQDCLCASKMTSNKGAEWQDYCQLVITV